MTRRTYAAALAACVLAAAPASADPPPGPPPEIRQWKQAVERPHRMWDYDGTRILGHVGKEVRLWDATTGEPIRTLESHGERIHAVQFSPDGRRALSSSWMPPGELGLMSRDTRVVLWDLETGRALRELPGEVAGEFSPDGARVVTFSQRPGAGPPSPGRGQSPAGDEAQQYGFWPEFDAAVWDVRTGRRLAAATLPEYANPYRDALHFSPDGRRFVHLDWGQTVWLNTGPLTEFDAADGRETGRVSAEAVRLDSGRRYTSRGMLATFNPETAARWIEPESGRVVRSVRTGFDEDDPLFYSERAWAHDGGRVAMIPSPEEGPLEILDMATGTRTRGDGGGPYGPVSIVVSPDDRRLAIHWHGADADGPGLGLYDLRTGRQIARTKLGQWDGLIGFSPDGETLLTGGPEFVVYDAETGEMLRTVEPFADGELRHPSLWE